MTAVMLMRDLLKVLMVVMISEGDFIIIVIIVATVASGKKYMGYLYIN